MGQPSGQRSNGGLGLRGAIVLVGRRETSLSSSAVRGKKLEMGRIRYGDAGGRQIPTIPPWYY